MVVLGVVGLLGNTVSILLRSRVQGRNLNTRAALLEVVNDALGSVAVLVAAALIWLTGWARADAVGSLVIEVMILPRTWKLLRETVDVLMEAPRGCRPGRRARPHPRLVCQCRPRDRRLGGKGRQGRVAARVRTSPR
jgi:cation diffusion facilitator family transporter